LIAKNIIGTSEANNIRVCFSILVFLPSSTHTHTRTTMSGIKETKVAASMASENTALTVSPEDSEKMGTVSARAHVMKFSGLSFDQIAKCYKLIAEAYDSEKKLKPTVSMEGGRTAAIYDFSSAISVVARMFSVSIELKIIQAIVSITPDGSYEISVKVENNNEVYMISDKKTLGVLEQVGVLIPSNDVVVISTNTRGTYSPLNTELTLTKREASDFYHKIQEITGKKEDTHDDNQEGEQVDEGADDISSTQTHVIGLLSNGTSFTMISSVDDTESADYKEGHMCTRFDTRTQQANVYTPDGVVFKNSGNLEIALATASNENRNKYVTLHPKSIIVFDVRNLDALNSSDIVALAEEDRSVLKITCNAGDGVNTYSRHITAKGGRVCAGRYLGGFVYFESSSGVFSKPVGPKRTSVKFHPNLYSKHGVIFHTGEKYRPFGYFNKSKRCRIYQLNHRLIEFSAHSVPPPEMTQSFGDIHHHRSVFAQANPMLQPPRGLSAYAAIAPSANIPDMSAQVFTAKRIDSNSRGETLSVVWHPACDDNTAQYKHIAINGTSDTVKANYIDGKKWRFGYLTEAVPEGDLPLLWEFTV